MIKYSRITEKRKFINRTVLVSTKLGTKQPCGSALKNIQRKDHFPFKLKKSKDIVRKLKIFISRIDKLIKFKL